jgi:hypothetical protein
MATQPPPSAPQKPSSSVWSKPRKSQSKVEIPWNALVVFGRLDGIISYLTKKHGGNVQEKGIVTITSKSGLNDDQIGYRLKKVADLSSDSYSHSKNQPARWVSWDPRLELHNMGFVSEVVGW